MYLLEDIEWAYEQDFESRERTATVETGVSIEEQRKAYANKTHCSDRTWTTSECSLEEFIAKKTNRGSTYQA